MLFQLNSIYNFTILRARYFPVLKIVQAGSRANPASYAVGTGYFRGVKRPGHDVDHSHPSSAQVKNR